MTVAIYILVTFSAIQFLTVVVNLLFPQKLKYYNITGSPLVSVLVPARNEENNIVNILNDIQNQSYQNYELIIFDDNSSDNTVNIVMEKQKINNKIKLIESKLLPENWLGKNWACHNLALKAEGEYLLFLDADVRAKPDLLKKTISYSQRYNLGLLTIFPKQIMKSVGEKLTVPLIHFILTTLLPLIFVRKSPFVSHSAGNGQFMLFNSNEYYKYYPHKKFKFHKVEDIKISRFFKTNKIQIACITGTDLVSCKMYNNYSEAINGFAKNIVMFFGNSYFFAFLFWFVNFIGPVIFFIFSSSLFSLLYGIIIMLNIIIFSIVSKQNILMNIFLFIPQMISMFVILLTSINYKFTKKQTWKGRYI